MSNLLKELQKLKPKLPEAEFPVPEWKRSVTLRGFSLREGRALRKKEGSESDDERMMLRTLAHAIVDGDDRPLANEDGMELLDTLSAKTLQEMGQAFMKLSGAAGEDAEKNLEPRAGASGSSTDLPSRSAEPLLN